jgi:hypothetical protein
MIREKRGGMDGTEEPHESRRREKTPALPAAEERRRLVHAVVRAVRGIIENDHDRLCLMYCCVGMHLLEAHVSRDYVMQVGHICVGTDSTDIPDHLVATDRVPEGYHAWGRCDISAGVGYFRLASI